MIKEGISYYENSDRALLQVYIQAATGRLLHEESAETGKTYAEVLYLALSLFRVARRRPTRAVEELPIIEKRNETGIGLTGTIKTVALKMQREAIKREKASKRRAGIYD